jgi:hypothetical protein
METLLQDVRYAVRKLLRTGFDIEDAGIDAYLPTGIPENPTNRGSHDLDLVGRLAPARFLSTAAASAV